jgi:VWFA-related protein
MIRTIGIVWLTFGLVLGQEPTKELNGHERNLIRSSLDQLTQDPVIVKVTVQNEKTGSSVLNLRAEDFMIDEDGERQKPTRFLREERSLSILLLLDSSGSMRPMIQPIIEALSNGLRHLKPDDEVALMSFSEAVYILQDFTRNKDLVDEKLRGVIAARPTLTRQALFQAATHMLKATTADSHRVIVVVTDNRQSSTPGDVLSEKVVMQQLSASGSVVCGVIVSDPTPNRYPPARDSFLTQKGTADITPYVDETGGIVETVKKARPDHISAGLAKTIDAFRNYYWIEYLSTNSKRDGKHRKIKVTLSPDVKKSGGELTVLAKRGYYAPNAATSGDQK